MKAALLPLGVVAALAAASTASRRGSQATELSGRSVEGLDARMKRMLEEEDPEVSLRALFIMEAVPGSTVSQATGAPVRAVGYSAVARPPAYFGAADLDRMRQDVAQVTAEAAGRPAPDLGDPASWASLPQVADFLWSWLDEGRWMTGERWDPALLTRRGLGGRQRVVPVLTPVAEWVISEVRRVVNDLPPVKIPFSFISSTRTTPAAGRRIVELNTEKMGRLLDYMLDVAASHRALQRLSPETRLIQESQRWARFGMEDVLSGSRFREEDTRHGVTSMRGLGGRRREVNAVHRALGLPRRGAPSLWSSTFRDPLWDIVDLQPPYNTPEDVPSDPMERRRKAGLTPDGLLIDAHMINLLGTLRGHWEAAPFESSPGLLYGEPWELLPEYEIVAKVAKGRVRSQPGQAWSGLRTRHRDWSPTP